MEERISMRHDHIYANQCRVLENALHELRVLENATSPWSLQDVNSHSGHSHDKKLKVLEITHPIWAIPMIIPNNLHFSTGLLRERAEKLLLQCTTPLKAKENWWLALFIGEENFSLILEEALEFASSILEICRRHPQIVHYTERFSHFLQSARKDLRSAAARDHSDLLAWLDKIIESPSDHEAEDDMDRAQFLDRVLSAHTKEAEKKARQINSEDLVYGNTLGHGSNAKVVTASWKGMSDFVVKVNRVTRDHDKEVGAMLGTNHPNVIRMIGHSSKVEPDINEHSVLLMERMDGDLEGLISSELSQKGTELPLDYNVDLLLQIARGIKYLHEKKIVHRDLKPANILFAKQPASGFALENLITLKIADFGCSRSPFDHRTMATAPIGTDMYMAPEILGARGDREVDSSMYGPEVDIYSFAMICYKVLTGLDPHLAWRDVLDGKRPPLKASARCPQALVSFIQKCWDKDPDKRPSASEVYEFLVLINYVGLLTTPAHEMSCLWYGITNTLLEKLVSFLGKEWLETEARALEEGTSEEDVKLHKQVTDFLSRLSKKSCIQQIWNWLPFVRLLE